MPSFILGDSVSFVFDGIVSEGIIQLLCCNKEEADLQRLDLLRKKKKIDNGVIQANQKLNCTITGSSNSNKSKQYFHVIFFIVLCLCMYNNIVQGEIQECRLETEMSTNVDINIPPSNCQDLDGYLLNCSPAKNDSVGRTFPVFEIPNNFFNIVVEKMINFNARLESTEQRLETLLQLANLSAKKFEQQQTKLESTERKLDILLKHHDATSCDENWHDTVLSELKSLKRAVRSVALPSTVQNNSSPSVSKKARFSYEAGSVILINNFTNCFFIKPLFV